jgi:hypothetical protein
MTKSLSQMCRAQRFAGSASGNDISSTHENRLLPMTQLFLDYVAPGYFGQLRPTQLDTLFWQ